MRLGFELLQQLLSQRDSGVHTREVLTATRKLIEFNPELSIIWNYRREVLSKLLEQRQVAPGKPQSHDRSGLTGKGTENSLSKTVTPPDSSGQEENAGADVDVINSSIKECSFCQHDNELSQLLQEELQLTTSGLARGGGKAYCLWLHRSWTLARSVAHEYERHRFHLPLCRALGHHKNPPAQQQQHMPQPQEQQKDNQQHNLERQARCDCCSAPCFANGSCSSPQCGLEGALTLLKEELDACEKILKEVDGRNFHCWQHRSMVVLWQAAFLQYMETQPWWRAPKLERGPSENAQDSFGRQENWVIWRPRFVKLGFDRDALFRPLPERELC